MNQSSRENQRLVREIQLLQRCEKATGLPAKPVIDQLVTYSDLPLPDTLPPVPRWVKFRWPGSGELNFVQYWKNYDWERRNSP